MEWHVLIRIKLRHIDADEFHTVILERCFGCRRKIAVACPNPDYQISLTRQNVRPRCSGYANRP